MSLADVSLADILASLNASAADPYAWLRHEPFGIAFAVLSKKLVFASQSLYHAASLFCRSPPYFSNSVCQRKAHCHVAELRSTLNETHTELRGTSRGIVLWLCRRAAPAALVGVAASLGSTSSQLSATTECIVLIAVLTSAIPGEQCINAYDLVLDCARSLILVGIHITSIFKTLNNYRKNDMIRSDCLFVQTWGSNRVSILSGLLNMISESQGRGDRTMLMAEVGVFQANTSVALLQQHINLEMLLVDPYHLHTKNHLTETQPLVDEFYASPRSTFEVAALSTQPFRSRATHILQTSAQAVRWLKPLSVDLVFIDGDHRYEAVIADIEAWWDYVRPGGIISGHDFSTTYPGVISAVTTFCIQNQVRLFFAPEMWWVVKEPELYDQSFYKRIPWQVKCKKSSGSCCW